MPVLPCCTNLFQNCKDLYQFLLTCQQISIERSTPQIVSIPVEVSPIDPLGILGAMENPNHLHFYIEKATSSSHAPGLKRESIVAIDSVLSLQVNGSDRFSQIKRFLDSFRSNFIVAGGSEVIQSPSFFGGVTFFDEQFERDSPFASATLFLPKWQISCQENRCNILANLLVNSDLDLVAASEALWHQFQEITSIRYEGLPAITASRSVFQQKVVQGIDHFTTSVKAALAAIYGGRLRKIVLAHAVDVFSPTPLRLVESLHRLRQLHPDCYIFSMGNGRGQRFIGASPERLVKIQDRHLMADALAGSAPRSTIETEDSQLADGLLRSQKELHEHRVVTDFISERLMELGLCPRLSPRRLLKLSHIQHLQTAIEAEVPPDLHFMDVLANLHPTPAVAGAPRHLACEHIRRYERFERSLYASPLGWIDLQGNGEFIVGIRSALVSGNRARLYAGAGIVAGSDPDRELAEVQLKLRALLEALV